MTKAARGSKTRMIDGVQHRKCNSCGEFLHPDKFTVWRWECDCCKDKRKSETLQMMLDAFNEMAKEGVNPFVRP